MASMVSHSGTTIFNRGAAKSNRGIKEKDGEFYPNSNTLYLGRFWGKLVP
jgi:hypothetical protein